MGELVVGRITFEPHTTLDRAQSKIIHKDFLVKSIRSKKKKVKKCGQDIIQNRRD